MSGNGREIGANEGEVENVGEVEKEGEVENDWIMSERGEE